MEGKTKHLEFIQTAITRMGVNSFLLKGWGVTVLVALFAFVSQNSKGVYFLLSFLILLFFWLKYKVFYIGSVVHRLLFALRSQLLYY